MSDITMCHDETCPDRHSCYRFTATPNPYGQSYFAGIVRKEGGECDYFWLTTSHERAAERAKLAAR